MFLIDKLAEAHIQEAIKRGELENLPGDGKPLVLDNDSMVPPELRAGYRLLKNAGFLPPEMQLRKDIANVEQLISVAQHADELEDAQKRMRYLKMKLELMRGNSASMLEDPEYQSKIESRFER